MLIPVLYKIIIEAKIDERNEQRLMSIPDIRKLQSEFLKRPWSFCFKTCDYNVIISTLDFLVYLMNNSIFNKLPNFEINLPKFNEELLKIIKMEILEYDELNKNVDITNIWTYYMMLEKKHIYLNPKYEMSTNSIYKHELKSEHERLMNPNPLLKEEPLERLSDYIDKLLLIKDCKDHPNAVKGEQYIYKIFPNSEARIKVVCSCIDFLRAEFKKLFESNDWALLLANDKLKNRYMEQIQKYIIVNIRLLQREEKCLYKRAKRSIVAALGLCVPPECNYCTI